MLTRIVACAKALTDIPRPKPAFRRPTARRSSPALMTSWSRDRTTHLTSTSTLSKSIRFWPSRLATTRLRSTIRTRSFATSDKPSEPPVAPESTSPSSSDSTPPLDTDAHNKKLESLLAAEMERLRAASEQEAVIAGTGLSTAPSRQQKQFTLKRGGVIPSAPSTSSAFQPQEMDISEAKLSSPSTPLLDSASHAPSSTTRHPSVEAISGQDSKELPGGEPQQMASAKAGTPATVDQQLPSTPPDSTTAEPSGAVLGRIEPKKITLEEAKRLGIDVEDALKKGDQKSVESAQAQEVFLSEQARRRREEDEKIKAFEKRDTGLTLPPELVAKTKTFLQDYYMWLIFGTLAVAPTLLSRRDGERSKLETEKALSRQVWKREEYFNLAPINVERLIFELCTFSAIDTLPPFNPIHAPIEAVRGDISAVYPPNRQGLQPPIFWKLRIDFPAPRETVWEKNPVFTMPVQPASPDYKGSQFMWILSRTWEQGQPIIRILVGKQVGGTVKANPKKSLIPWRMTAFRPRLLSSTLLRPLEIDAVANVLDKSETNFHALKEALPNRFRNYKELEVDWRVDELDYDLLERAGLDHIIWDPNSYDWPDTNMLILNPLADIASENLDDYGLPQYTQAGPEQYDLDEDWAEAPLPGQDKEFVLSPDALSHNAMVDSNLHSQDADVSPHESYPITTDTIAEEDTFEEDLAALSPPPPTSTAAPRSLLSKYGRS